MINCLFIYFAYIYRATSRYCYEVIDRRRFSEEILLRVVISSLIVVNKGDGELSKSF